jgi:hypothetical protein
MIKNFCKIGFRDDNNYSYTNDTKNDNNNNNNSNNNIVIFLLNDNNSFNLYVLSFDQ